MINPDLILQEIHKLRQLGADPLDAIIIVQEKYNLDVEWTQEFLKKDKVLMAGLERQATDENLIKVGRKLPV